MMEKGKSPMEYVGHLKFGPLAGKPITPEGTLDDWLERAKGEFRLSRVASVIYNATDEEMEGWVNDADSSAEVMEMLADIAECCQDWVERYKAGIDVFDAVLARCVIIGEHIEAQQKAS